MKPIQKNEIKQLVNSIGSRSVLMNEFLIQIVSAYERDHHMLAFAGTVMTLEHMVKFSAGMVGGNFHTAMKNIKNENRITSSEYDALNFVRQIRNSMFHDDPYSMVLEIDGKACFLSEDSTYERLLDDHFVKILRIMNKLYV